MTRQELQELFDRHDGEYLRFERVQNPKSRRQDMHAFLLLDELAPPVENELGVCKDMVCHNNDDCAYLGTDLDTLLRVITEDHVLELVRCGVFYNGENHLKMIA